MDKNKNELSGNNSTGQSTEVLTMKQAAERLGISVQTLRRIMFNCEIDSTRAGKKHVFREYHIEQYLERNEIKNYHKSPY